ncbi:nucleosome assembly protein [Dictyocaulus viviparus]|uniref:Nucleosome assembly protein n=1 Tax=Dictyocaulus viviparus TaxID=29172 RepID=A0A0D8XYQ9_DICVI|nr:nucleosome assembly protein [Dictyocaulus viviparus]
MIGPETIILWRYGRGNMEGDKREIADIFKDGVVPDIVSKISMPVKRRICALKKIQLDSIEVMEAKFYERVHQLEKEFETEFDKLYEQRKKIVAGEYEPTDEESNLPIIHGLREEAIKELNEKSAPDDGSKGVPSFWLHVLKGSEMTQDMIQEHDEPILKHLTDITSTIEVDPHGFTIYFHFSPNEFFTNTVLKKQYFLEIKPDPEDPFSFDGPSVVRAIGDTIDWKEGKNITKKVVKKKLKKGSNAGNCAIWLVMVKADSFFNFFDTIVPPSEDHKNEDDEEDDSHEVMRADFEVGQVLRDNIISRAVLYYTGEADLGDDMYDLGELAFKRVEHKRIPCLSLASLWSRTIDTTEISWHSKHMHESEC